MRVSLLMVSLMASACAGCLHAPPNYPGAGGDNLDPRQFTNEACVDLSGRYEGKGEIVDGDPGSLRDQRTWRLDNVFPFASREQLDSLSAAARRPDGFYAPPQYGIVERKSDRTYYISFAFPNGKTASFSPSFEDKGRFVCTGLDGKIVWGGASEGGRSEFGPNSSDSIKAIYLDAQGNLILERGMQVHMNLRLLLIPVGTAKYSAVYRFRRLK
ncbi:hypothetical protein [Ralstonia pseudosolanacearum]|uniref:hypothetical protein n=1 Tax=Ralstonia pseudosolanacearum TaxID=1310165 RepID=UPI000B01E518|nr:hypothetical protein MAFF211491_35740 [Ralstonia solanacearum]BCM14565.1 hypothetical protein MAFF241648_37550 [Ralstonia solanacearum]BCN13151.1 hypothetical protein RPSD_50360 [Ralstonia solanacearum]